MTTKKQASESDKNDATNDVEPGMVVAATKGDLGEEDVSKPKVSEVIQDEQGNVAKFVVKKGLIFKKTLEIPADRITSIDQENDGKESEQAKIIVDVSKAKEESPPAPVKKSNFLLHVLGPGF